MASSTSTTISTTVIGPGFSSTLVPAQCPIVNPNPFSAAPQLVNLTTGNNGFTAPAGCQYVLVIPPVGSTVQLTLKGINADTGIPMALGMPLLLPIPAAGVFVLTAAGPVQVQLAYL